MRLTARKLTAQAFAPYGQVLELVRAGIGRQENTAELVNRRGGAQANLVISRIEPIVAPLRLEVLERHLFSSQTFLPTDLARYLVVVCPSSADGEPVLERMDAFVAEGGQGINYGPSVWHHPFAVLDRSGAYVMLRFDDGSEEDTEFRRLADGAIVEVPDMP